MSKRRKSTQEDEELWSRVTRTVVPLHKGRLVPGAAQPDQKSSTKTELRASTSRPALPSYTPPVSKPSAPHFDLDKPAYKRLSKGKQPIDARIDLHDMTQSVAYHRLSNFLSDARAGGLRHVLVITGKGTSSGGEGVLRRMVPLWLNTEPMKHHVSAFSASARHHGGEGALYVRLKKQ